MSMASYQAILNDLNRDVTRAQPGDVLQFCANWVCLFSDCPDTSTTWLIMVLQFNHKLEEERRASLLKLFAAVPTGTGSASSSAAALEAPPRDARAQSVPASSASTSEGPTHQQKGPIPSLVGQDYTFGSSGSNNSTANAVEPMMSPFSEHGPAPSASVSSAEAPFPPTAPVETSTSSASDAPPSSSSVAAAARQQSPSEGSSAPPPAWTKQPSFSAIHGASIPQTITNSRKESNATSASGDSVSEESSPRHTTPMGIPLNYNLGRRTSVSAESLNPMQGNSLPKTVIPKTASQRARIEASIKGNLLFRNLDEEQHNDVLNAMKEVRVPQGTEVVVQGAVGDFFYVVESGQFEVWVKPPPAHRYDAASRRTLTDQAPAKMVARIESGGSFGELALMYNAPRAATVVSVAPSTLWALDRVTFRSILMEHTSRKRKMYEHFLAEVNILVSLESHERAKIADALEEKVYEEGEPVVIEGEVGKNFYIIESGSAQVLKRNAEGHDEEVSTLGRGDYFGGRPCFRVQTYLKFVADMLSVQSWHSSTQHLELQLCGHCPALADCVLPPCKRRLSPGYSDVCFLFSHCVQWYTC